MQEAQDWPDDRTDDVGISEVFGFVRTVDALKGVLRANPIPSSGRRENVAEHSWHVALLALALVPRSQAAGVNLGRVVAMLLVHDLPEVVHGDHPVHETDPKVIAADDADGARVLYEQFPLGDLRELWAEFEGGDTPEARVAQAVDKLHPILMNFWSGGGSWLPRRADSAAGEFPGVSRDRVEARAAAVVEGLPELDAVLRELLTAAEAQGMFRADAP